MSFNLVTAVKEHTDGQLLGQMGQLLGEEGSQASAALDSAVPAMLSGLLGTTRTSKGADNLFTAVQQQDDDLLNNLGALLSSGKASSVIERGNSVFGGLLGKGGLGKLAGALSSFSGISRGGTGTLMGMLVPVILGVLKRKVGSDGLNSASLARLFSDQSDNLSLGMPTGLEGALNTSGFLSSITQTHSNATLGAATALGGTIAGTAEDVYSRASNATSEHGTAWSSKASDATADLGASSDTALNQIESLGHSTREQVGAAADDVSFAARRGMQTATNGMSTAADASIEQAQEIVRTGSIWTKLLAPLLIIGLLAWAGYMFYLSQQNASSTAAAQSTETSTAETGSSN